MLGSFFSGSRIQHPIVLLMLTIGLFFWYAFQTEASLISWHFWGMEYDVYGRWGQTLGMIFWIVGGLWLNKVVTNLGFAGQHYYIPVFSVLFGITLLGTSSFLQISQAFIFLSIFVAVLDRINEDHTSTFWVFDLGMVIGGFMCFHYQYIVFLPLAWMFFMVYGLSYFRFILVSTVGVITTVVLVATVWKVLSLLFSGLITYRFSVSLPESLLSSNKVFLLVTLGLLFIFTLSEIKVAISRGNISKRHFATFGLLVLILCIVAGIGFSALPVFIGSFLGFIILFTANRMNHLSGKRREIAFYSILAIVLVIPLLFKSLY
jgi:hypothetical protein